MRLGILVPRGEEEVKLTLLIFFFPLFVMPLFSYGVDTIVPLMVLYSGIYVTLLILVFVIGNPS